MDLAKIAIIGGSGLYNMQNLKNIKEYKVSTALGATSSPIICAELEGVKIAFLARHGQNHSLLPSEVPYRANILALKDMGVKYILSFSAVGSLREELRPRDMVIPSQYIDFTRKRESTFFGDGCVAHVSMAEPICLELQSLLIKAAEFCTQNTASKAHKGGTYVCIEGPQFSSKAESNFYRQIGADLVGMTNMPEAKLAKEAQIAYASLCMVTDYDCWHPHEENVTADYAIANLKYNAELAQKIACKAVQLFNEKMPFSSFHTALKSSLVTPLNAMPIFKKEIIEILLK